jgi:pyrroloquinoline quinone (PQQ) biosynthesis protein C
MVDGGGALMLNANSRPWLRADVSWHIDPAQTEKAQIMAREYEYGYPPEAWRILLPVLPHMDGGPTVADLAERCACSVPTLAGLLQPLLDDDLVLDSQAALAASTLEEFRDALQRECRFWHGTILAQPFWQRLLSGSASTAMVLGWGVEFMHFADAANEYMAAGVAYCREPGDLRESIAKHYIEESGHGEIFRCGLHACGVAKSALAQAAPLPTTRALINHLWEVALESSLAYGASFKLMQAAEVSKAAAESFYDGLCEFYPDAHPLFQAFRLHTEIDVGLSHESTIFDLQLDRKAALQWSEKQRSIAVVRDLAEHFCAFFEGIRRYYDPLPAFAVRRPRSSAFVEYAHGHA